MLSTTTPILPGKEDAPHSTDPRSIFLAPRCCIGYEGRLWCEDNVWPCSDCPNPKEARVARYALVEQIKPASDDPEDRGEI